MNALTTFRNETLLLSVGNARLVEVDRPFPEDAGKRMFVAVHRDGLRTDYPLMTEPGRIYWGTPEWFTRRFRVRASRKISRLSRS